MLLARVVSVADLGVAILLLWRPLLAIVSIMVTTAVAQHIGLLDRLAAILFARTGGAASRVFTRVFVLAALTAALLNNDSAVLLLTPAVVSLVRRRYPRHPQLVLPFAFAVFMAAGVAPLVLSNPMNMIFAAYARIDFNQYALRMLPISIAGCVLAGGILRVVFRRVLGSAPSVEAAVDPAPPLDVLQLRMLLVMGGVLLACPFVAYAGAPVWPVAVVGAGAALLLVGRSGAGSPAAIVQEGISWEIVAFLVLVSVLGVGLRNVGIVGRLADLYAGGDVSTIGAASALGSAVLNNHPMSILNMLALEHGGQRQALAALIGGDLGPRLLPMGSLAGLLWLDALRKLRVDVSLGAFVRLGLMISVPTLALSLAMLRWM